jgi:hypothetical protein
MFLSSAIGLSAGLCDYSPTEYQGSTNRVRLENSGNTHPGPTPMQKRRHREAELSTSHPQISVLVGMDNVRRSGCLIGSLALDLCQPNPDYL